MFLIPILAAIRGIEPMRLEQRFETGGCFALFVVLFLCGIGLPLPEDIPLLAAGVAIAAGKMHWGSACICAWCGIIGGDLVLYHIGRHFGRSITRVPIIGRHINPERLDRLEVRFHQHGIWVVAIGRMFAGVRGAMVVVAGTMRYNRVKFIIADGLAAIVSGGLFVFLGYWLGQKLPEYLDRIKRGKGIATVIIAAAVLLVAGIWWLRRKRRAAVPASPLA